MKSSGGFSADYQPSKKITNKLGITRILQSS